MQLSQLCNVPVPVALAGRPYPVRQLRLREWAALSAWLRETRPNPVTVALRAIRELADAGVPPSPTVERRLLDLALAEAQAWPPPVASSAWLDAVDRADGGAARFVALALRAGGTDVTDDQAEDIAWRATRAEVGQLVRVAYFGDPPEAELAAEDGGEGDDGPKAAAPGPTTGG